MSSPASSVPVETPLSSAPVVRGQRLMILLIPVMLAVAGAVILGLRTTQHRRFAVSLSSIPASANPKVVPIDKPLLLRIDHSSPRSQGLVPLAILLDADGNALSELQPLHAVPGPNGKTVEQLEFPPLGKVPVRGLVSGLVMRVSEDTPAVRARLAEALELGKPKTHQLPRAFTRAIVASRELGGHAEQSQREVR